MPYYQKFVKDLGLIGLVQTILRLKAIILLPILTKSLGAESYGIWAQILVTISILGPLLLLSLPSAIVRFLPGSRDKKDTQKQIWSGLAFVSGVTLIGAVLLLLFGRPIGSLLEIPYELIILLAIILILKSANAVLLSVFKAFQEMRTYAAFLFILGIGETTFIIASILMGYGLTGAVASMVIIRLVVFLIMFGMILKKVGISIPDFARIKEYLAFSLPLVTGSVSYWVVQASDRYLLVGFLGVLFVGYYAPAYALALTINIFILPIGLILPATLSKLFAENRTQMIQAFLAKSLKYTLFLTIPAAFGLTVLSNQLLLILTTQEIAANASHIIPLVAASIVLYGIAGTFSHILFLYKKTKITGTIWFGVAILNITLNILLIPFLGIMGAALATIISYIVALALIWYFSFKYLSFSIDWISIGKSIAAASLMTGAIAIFHPVGLTQTLVSIVVGAILYGILSFALKNLDKKEIEFFRGLR